MTRPRDHHGDPVERRDIDVDLCAEPGCPAPECGCAEGVCREVGAVGCYFGSAR